MENLLKLGLQFFADGDGSNGAGQGSANTAAANTGANTSTGDAGKNGGQGMATGDQNQNQNTGSKTFTQEEVNRMMATEKEQGRKAILKELGVEDAKSAKEGLSKYKEYLDSQKTDLQKAQDKEKELSGQLTTKEQENLLLKSKFVAIEEGVKTDCVDDVLALAMSKVSESKDLKAVIGELKTKYPNFFGETTKSGGTGNVVSGKNGTIDTSNLGTRLASSSKPAQKSSYFN